MPIKPPAVLFPDDPVDAYAIQSFAEGVADEAAQKRAWRWIVEDLCGTYHMSYDPESDRQTIFAEGRRHVGRTLVNIAHTPVGAVKAITARFSKRRPKGPEHG